MSSALLIVLVLLALVALVFLVLLWRRSGAVDFAPLKPWLDGATAETRRVEQSIREELSRQREEESRRAMELREELSRQLQAGLSTLLDSQRLAREAFESRFEALRSGLEIRLQQFSELNDQRLDRLRLELGDSATQNRQESRQSLADFQKAVREALAQSGEQQRERLTDFALRLDRVNATIEARLTELLTKSEARLEEMRKTVDEKLQSTLEKRLGESFKMVSDNLERVVKSLGEMQQIAAGVGDLKRVLTNVKARGVWGEVQLALLLEQIMTPEQYATNVAVSPGSNERVEFAIRLPGRDDAHTVVWLPIDSKFPQEDYQRLMEASDRADVQGVADTSKALEIRLRAQAAEIHAKYIVPPHTTDFGILFLPTEGLFAEVLRRPGLTDDLQRIHRVVVAGPTTLGALLNSLQMGFRTLAIEQRSGEVWRVLGAVKTEFAKFGDVLAKVKKKLDEASDHINKTEIRSRAINRRLREVEALPVSETDPLLPGGELALDDGEAEGPEEAAPLPNSV